MNFENIASGTASNFAKQGSSSTNDLGVALDIGSVNPSLSRVHNSVKPRIRYSKVMMYGTGAFSKNGRPTISALDPNYAKTFGNREALSFTDIKQMNMLYCSRVCGSGNSQGCENGGYADPRDCSRCRCPEGFGGRRCESVQASRGCGGLLSATNSWQSLSASSQDCNWLLRAPNGGAIQLQLDSITYSGSGSCTRYVEVKASRDFQVAGPRLCGLSGSRSFRSLTSQVVVLARGRGSFSGRFRVVGGRPGPVTVRPPRPTRPSFTTPPRPIFRTTTPRPTGNLGWTSWSGCTVPCGGCGSRSRTRLVNGGRTRQRETRSCNTQPCRRRSQVPADVPATVPEGVAVDEPFQGSEWEERIRVKRQSRRRRRRGFCCEGYRIRRGKCVRRRNRG